MLSKRWMTFYWISLAALVAASVIQISTNGFVIKRDLFSTLPAVSRDTGFLKAQAAYQDQLGRKMVFAVIGESTEQLKAAIGQLESALIKNGHFENVRFKFDKTDLEKINSYYYPRRQQLLTPLQLREIESVGSEEVVQKYLARFYSPIGSAQQIETDPFGYYARYLTELGFSSSLKNEDGLLIGRHQNKPAALMSAEIRGDWQDYSYQLELKSLIENFKKANPQLEILSMGLANYMRAGVERAQIEISTIGLGSLLGAAVLLLWIFRSAMPLAASALLLIVSIGISTLITHLFFGSIHFFTLILGSSLVGLIDDYSFHFFAQRFDSSVRTGTEAREKIKKSLTYSLITTVLGFVFLFITPFPVLKQLGVFAIAGFITAFLAIWTFYRHLPHRFSTYPSFWQKSAKWTLKLLAVDKTQFALGALILLIFGGVLLARVEFSDDVRLMQSLPKNLKYEEDSIKALLGDSASQTYILVRAPSFEELQAKEEELKSRFEASFKTPLSAFSNWVPSLNQQKISFEVYEQELLSLYRRFFHLLKIDQKKSEEALNSFKTPFKPITFEEAKEAFQFSPFYQQFLGEIDSQFYSVVLLPASASAIESTELHRYDSQDVQVVNLAEDTSKIMTGLRSAITLSAAVGWVMTLITVSFLIGIKRAGHIVLTPTLAVLFSLGLAFELLGPLNLFHLLAAILVFSLGIDYTFFFSDCRDSIYVPTFIAVTAAAITTGLSFGLMSLSQTAAISGFGVTIAIGIVLCLLLSPFAVRAQ